MGERNVNEFLSGIRGEDILDHFEGIEIRPQGVRESTAEPNGIIHRGAKIGESFRGLAQSPVTSVTSYIVRRRGANSGNAKKRKKRNRKL